jgi:DNA recombination protein RmuC
MDALHILLLAVTVVAGGGLVATLWKLGRAQAECVAERARAAGLERERDEARSQGEARERTLREQIARADARLEQLQAKHADLDKVGVALRAELDASRNAAEVERAHMERREREFREEVARDREALREQFRAIAAETVDKSTKALVTVAGGELEAKGSQIGSKIEGVLGPMRELLRQTGDKIAALDKDRASTHATMAEHMQQVAQAGGLLREETRRLAEALRRPDVRGRYGELQLRRVAELAGMAEYCDFSTQETARDGDQSVRPDMVVRMPSGRTVVVDSKTNIQEYLDALRAKGPEDAEQHLERFAQHVASQVGDLSRKQYWKHFEGSPEFVVMFVPGEQFLDAALQRQPEMLERAARQGVILATPSSLIALLRAVAVGYREEKLAREAEELRELGRTFHKHLANALEPIAALGQQLDRASRSYNQFVGSYDANLRRTVERFEEAGLKGKKEVPALGGVEAQVRAFEVKALPAPEDLGRDAGASGKAGDVPASSVIPSNSSLFARTDPGASQ